MKINDETSSDVATLVGCAFRFCHLQIPVSEWTLSATFSALIITIYIPFLALSLLFVSIIDPATEKPHVHNINLVLVSSSEEGSP